MDSLDAAIARGRARRRLPSPEARRVLRERAGVTQQDVAAAVGVTREAVSQWEAGRRDPRPPRLARYLEVLDRLAEASR